MNNSADYSNSAATFIEKESADSEFFSSEKAARKLQAPAFEKKEPILVVGAKEEAVSAVSNFNFAGHSLYQIHRFVLEQLQHLSDDEIEQILQLRPRHYFSSSSSVQSNLYQLPCLMHDLFSNHGRSDAGLIRSMQKKVAYPYFTNLFKKALARSGLTDTLEELKTLNHHIATLEKTLETTTARFTRASLHTQLIKIRRFFDETKQKLRDPAMRHQVHQMRALLSYFGELAKGAPAVKEALKRFKAENGELLAVLHPPHIHFDEQSHMRIFSPNSEKTQEESIATLRAKSLSPRTLEEERLSPISFSLPPHES